MADYNKNWGSSVEEGMLLRIAELERQVTALSGNRLLTLDRLVPSNVPAPVEGQQAVRSVDEKHTWYSNGAWRTAGQFDWAFQVSTAGSGPFTAPPATGPPWSHQFFGHVDLPVNSGLAFGTSNASIFSIDTTYHLWKVPADGARYLSWFRFHNSDGAGVPVISRWIGFVTTWYSDGGAPVESGVLNPPVADCIAGHVDPVGNAALDDNFVVTQGTAFFQVDNFHQSSYIGFRAYHEDTGASHSFQDLASFLIRLT